MAKMEGLVRFAQGFRPQPAAVRSAALHKPSARVRISSLLPDWAAPNGGEGGIGSLCSGLPPPACGCPFRCAAQTLCSGSHLIPLT